MLEGGRVRCIVEREMRAGRHPHLDVEFALVALDILLPLESENRGGCAAVPTVIPWRLEP
eukprot:5043080-Prymnesium_polylepis.1